MAQFSSTTPYSRQTDVGNYANVLLPGFKSKKMQPLGAAAANFYNIGSDQKQTSTARGTALHVDMFSLGGPSSSIVVPNNRERSAVSTRDYLSPKSPQPANKRIENMNKTSPQFFQPPAENSMPIPLLELFGKRPHFNNMTTPPPPTVSPGFPFPSLQGGGNPSAGP